MKREGFKNKCYFLERSLQLTENKKKKKRKRQKCFVNKVELRKNKKKQKKKQK